MRLICSLLCGVFVSFQAHAAPPSPESVETLFSLMKLEASVEASYASIEAYVRQSINQAGGGEPATPEQKQFVENAVQKSMALAREDFTWAKIKPEYLEIYTQTFDQQEVDGLIAFYKSPTGQAFVNKLPVVTQKSVAVSQTQMQALMPKVVRIIRQAAAEAKLGGANK